jgi:ADP-heptose:LPS heptosyltransferase
MLKSPKLKKSNILLVNITRLGDMLQATPTICGMKMENPEARITVVVEKQFKDICHSLPYIDEVVALDLSFIARSITAEGEALVDAYEYVSSVVEDLRGRNFDYCLNMSSSGYTAMLLKLIDVPHQGGWSADEEGYRIIQSDWAKLFASSVYHQNRQYTALNLVDVFRCSADVEQHPLSLKMNVSENDRAFAQKLLAEAGFTDSGPIITVQSGASQAKRQWDPRRFIALIQDLRSRINARVVLIGTKKELNIVDPIKAAFAHDTNVFVAAGKTNVAQVGAVIQASKILVTGDTGPMHIAVAVGTPVVSMFLASAFGFETGPYSEGNIVIQPVIGCGPCNPNKVCSGLECHDTIEPKLVSWLVEQRLQSDRFTVPDQIADPAQALVYRTTFDSCGFYDMERLNSGSFEHLRPYRDAYRKMWLSDVGGQNIPIEPKSTLRTLNSNLDGIDQVIQKAQAGTKEISRLESLILNPSAAASELSACNTALSEIDRNIEQIGFHYGYLGPLTRMFIFAKENISGTDPLSLASQMKRVYQDLVRRSEKLSAYFM